MNTLTIIILLTVSLAEISKGQKTTRISDFNRELLAKQAQTTVYRDAVAPPPEIIDQTTKKRTALSQRVTFLSDGKMTVIIPNGAVIHLPSEGRVSLQNKIVGRLVEWNEFYLQNRNAIRLEDLSIKQLNGLESIDEEAFERIKKANLPTLTTYKNKVVALSAPANTLSTP